MEEKKGITLTELFDSLLKRWYIVFMTIVLGVLVTGIMAFFVITPKYKSIGKVFVHLYKPNESGEDELNLIDTQRFIPTIADHLKSYRVTLDVIQELEADLSASQITSGLKVSYAVGNDTKFFIEVSFTSTDKDLAKIVTQQVMQSAYDLANEKDGKLPWLAKTFSIVEEAKDATYLSPNKTLYLIVGFLLGAIVGAALVFVLEFGTYTYKTKEEIEHDLKIEVMGVIPEYVADKKPQPDDENVEEEK